ncbi:uncharacterized protein LOC112142522 [Oryzias melastigma]|uniref:uncharacterized protein LOC112142522 n=1 Tax=Oryzias melastigma TaxID=30732 RepID=UPI000CF7C76C|nr:uncharacterized protein LOC112142522 [Oryzias melastigma]
MSEPSGPHDGSVRRAETWKDLKSCGGDASDLKQSLLCDCSCGSHLSAGTGQGTEGLEGVSSGAVPGGFPSGGQILKPSEQEESSCTDETECMKEPEGCSLDSLRIVKHKPSAIVFCDYNHTPDSQETVPNESSDGKESSSSSLKAEEGDDDFPETLQYKEFLVSRHRRNLSRNRKCLRRRQDFLCHGAVPERPNNKDKPGFTGDLEEEEEQNRQV